RDPAAVPIHLHNRLQFLRNLRPLSCYRPHAVWWRRLPTSQRLLLRELLLKITGLLVTAIALPCKTPRITMQPMVLGMLVWKWLPTRTAEIPLYSPAPTITGRWLLSPPQMFATMRRPLSKIK